MTLELVIEDIDFWESPWLPIRKKKYYSWKAKKFSERKVLKKGEKKILGNRVLTLEIDMVKGVAEFIQYWRA